MNVRNLIQRLRDRLADEAVIRFDVGRWTVHLFNFDAIGCWNGRRDGYDCLWEYWGFGFLLQLERETDYLLDLAERYPRKDAE